MIEPFVAGQVRTAHGERIVSYGTSSYGYDVRCAPEFKIFTNINSTIVDPKAFDEKSFVDVHADVCIIPPNSFALARTVEYFRVPRTTLIVCLGKSTYARCFRGDTRVALVDGTSPTLEEMARRSGDGEFFWGYSIGTNGRLIVSLLDSPRFVGRDMLIEVELDSGERVAATPDHEFMLRDGRMLAAGQLRPGQSLMPLYRDCARGYEMVYQPINGHLYPTHRLADAAGTHRHHIDFDRRNKRPTNIEPMLHRFPEVVSPLGGANHWNHRVTAIRELAGQHDVYCLSVPEAGNFALEAGVFVHNCGIIVNVTPLEPEWEGHVTLEFSNTTPLPGEDLRERGCGADALLRGGRGLRDVVQKDRGGKYQGQRGVTLPKT